MGFDGRVGAVSNCGRVGAVSDECRPDAAGHSSTVTVPTIPPVRCGIQT